MSMEDYIKQINDLREWFKNELKSFPVLEMSRASYRGGVDSLPENYRQLTNRAFNVWLDEKRYELSYNQMCQAFFRAANDLGLLKVEAG
jgi:hypothetical protein